MLSEKHRKLLYHSGIIGCYALLSLGLAVLIFSFVYAPDKAIPYIILQILFYGLVYVSLYKTEHTHYRTIKQKYDLITEENLAKTFIVLLGNAFLLFIIVFMLTTLIVL